MVGKDEENKKMSFHQMEIEFVHFSKICLASLDDDWYGFGRHQIWSPTLDGEQNGFICRY
jgi:hypothetical protein